MSEQLTLGGIVVSDEEWTEYQAACAQGGAITVRFAGERQRTRIWRDGSGGLLCQKGSGATAPVVPLYAYSEVTADPNTEAMSESAMCLQRLIASGLPMPLALRLTNQLYARRPHSWPVPDALMNRILEKWQAGELLC
jgi:hypothetical protein